jgi:hypothetical protein
MRRIKRACDIISIEATGCDPGVHVAWEKDFDGAIDPDCVERALRTVAPDVRRTTYVDDGYVSLTFGADPLQEQPLAVCPKARA